MKSISRPATVGLAVVCSLSFAALGYSQTPASPQDSSGTAAAVQALANPMEGLVFSFERTPWRDVIRWIADECDLALHYEELPAGSFSYSDSNRYSTTAAIARLNVFLQPQGFTLVRGGRLLAVINMNNSGSMRQLDTLATMVAPAELAELDDYEVVKCMFPLGELETAEALEELTPLNLMSSPTVFSRTKQLLITDTVAKLRSVKSVLEAFQPAGLGDGLQMKTFTLMHVTAEDILTVARPHLGLATGEMIGIDVSLSADLQGEHLFVSGVEEKVNLIEGLVKSLDQPQGVVSTSDGVTELRSHVVEGGNVETVYNVLQTLLAGKSLRLSMDQQAGTIVALASPDVQAEIQQTVQQLQATEADFEVIPLKSIDPYFAISLLEEMLEPPTATEKSRGRELAVDTPKIDADPGNMRLFVRAKRHQIEQIKKIVAGLDTSSSNTSSETLRILPLRGRTAEQLLETAARFWRGANAIVLYPASDDETTARQERIVAQAVQPESRFVAVGNERRTREARVLSESPNTDVPMIHCQLTARGLLVQSDDSAALDQFETHLRAIVGPSDDVPSPPVVFYLQYSRPDDALRMLAELLDGGETAKEGEAGTLVNGYVASPGSFLGSIVTSRDDTTTMMAGSLTVVADSRLNRLIAQGTTNDIERIEDYLKIIDKDNSIASVMTYGRAHVIELNYTSATEMADSIREAFAGRVASARSGQPAVPQPGSPPAPVAKNPEPDSRDSRNKNEEPGKKTKLSSDSRALEPMMTIAIHEPSNSLIVTAPDQLFQEVEQLVKAIDQRSQQTVEVLSSSNAILLQSILQPNSQTGSASRSSSSERGSSSRSSSASSSGASQSAQFLEMLKNRSGR